MKTRTYLSIFILLVAVLVLFAGKKISIEDTYGTWVNADYNEKGQMAKEIDHPDGTYDRYPKLTDTEPTWIAEKTITGSWYDEEGNLWVKCTYFFEEERSSFQYEEGSLLTYYGVYKFSDSGKIRESVWSVQGYPDEMSPIAGNYAIHYRQ
ncbi:MAG TPA: hypothetical protein VMZ05_07470 [Spirochaetota bacterium]|nr:hypothetical protein [Spirochaetota bacterium]